MESDSESELLRARFEALKLPIQPSDAPKPQLSPTASTIDRAALDADLRQRLQALGMSGSDTGTEIDEEELERWLASEDEWLDDFKKEDGAARKEDIRQLVSKLHEAGLQSSSIKSKPQRQDSTRTITVRNNYKADSDADDEDEAEAEDLIGRVNEEILLESRALSNIRDARGGSEGSGYEEDDGGDDTDDEESLRGGPKGQRTPPSRPKQLSADTDVGKYAALFSSLETPRAMPTMTRSDPSEPLPPLFARLQSIKAHDGVIGEESGQEVEAAKQTSGTTPKLDIEGWRAAKDDKPDTWCCICNKDAVLRCPQCDNDLYCRSCFKQGHDRVDDELTKHKPVNYPSDQD
ncbi:Abscission/NoCut checkpoint regulator [Tulasnella sp. 418]|nr:Abscission/NoCut checkpoint regulator [Tulasnella sp. 418]